MIGIREEAGGFVIGAATPGAMLEAHAALKAAWPGVVEAMDLIGSKQIQGRASLAGNLCNASPAADSVPAMIAAARGRRDRGPERASARCRWRASSTGPAAPRSRKGEFILASSRLPPRPAHAGDAYLRFIPRTEMDIAVVGCGVNVTLDADGVVHRRARRARRRRADAAAGGRGRRKALIGHKLDEATLREAGRGGARRLQADQRQARHDRISHQGGRRARAPRRRHRLRTRGGSRREGALRT